MENNIEPNPMNQDIFAGKWKQMRGEFKSWWGKLTDDDFDKLGGQKDKLIGLLQERYGYTREQAALDVERRLREYGDKTGRLLAACRSRHESSARLPRRKPTRRHPLSVRR